MAAGDENGTAAEDAWQAIAISDLDGVTCSTTVVQERRDDTLGSTHLALDDELGELLAAAAERWLAKADDSRLVPYDPGYQPSADEIAYMAVSDIAELDAVLTHGESAAALDLFTLDTAIFSRLRAYVVSVELGGEWFHFTRKLTDSFRLSRTKGIQAFFRQGQYRRMPVESIQLDPDFDAFVSQGFVFISNQANFERSFGFVELAEEAVRDTLDSALDNLNITGVKKFIQTAVADTRMHRKVRSINQKLDDPDYAARLTMENILALIDSRDDIKIETKGNGKNRKLVFDPDPQQRFTILRILDDDYLTSELTEWDYEAGSKQHSR